MNRTFFILSLFALLTPLTSFAVAPDGVVIVDTPSGGGIVNGASFGMLGKANRSYLCAISVGGSDYTLSTSILTPSGATITGIQPNSSSEATAYLDKLIGADAADLNSVNNLLFFVAPSGAAESGKYTFTIGINSGTASSFSASCVETSILCDFNTNLDQYNFLEITSKGKKTGAAKLRLIKADGSEAEMSSTLSLPAGLRRDFDIHSLAGTNSYGTLIIQAIGFAPLFDGFTDVKVSTYKNGEMRSSVVCQTYRAFIS